MNLVFRNSDSNHTRITFFFDTVEVGGITIQKKSPTHIHLWNFAITKNLRNMGYGRASLTKVLVHYSDLKITLGVYADNKPALHLYRSLGFEIISGQGGGCYIMQKMKPNETEDIVR